MHTMENVISECARAVTRLRAALCVCVVRTRDVCQTRPRPPRQPLGGCGLVAGPPELPLPPKRERAGAQPTRAAALGWDGDMGASINSSRVSCYWHTKLSNNRPVLALEVPAHAISQPPHRKDRRVHVAPALQQSAPLLAWRFDLALLLYGAALLVP